MEQVQFDEQGFALTSGYILVNICNSEGIYTHSEEQWISEGGGLAANAYLEQPPVAKQGFAVIRGNDGWEYIADHRGETVYSTIDRQPIEITALGDYPENSTKLAPDSELCEWDGSKWVLSAEKQSELLEQKCTTLIEAVDNRASAIYSHWTRFASEYQARLQAAEAYRDAGYTGEVSKYIASFADPAGLDYKTATNLIFIQAQGLQKLQDELAAQRMRKYEIKNATTVEQMQAAYDDILRVMASLEEAYKNG